MGGKEFKVEASPGSGLDKYDVAYFTASCDEPETNRKYAEALKLDYAILSDPDKKTAKAYGVLSDRGYASRWTYFIGKDGKVLFIDKNVDARAHVPQIVAKLKELGVPKR